MRTKIFRGLLLVALACSAARAADDFESARSLTFKGRYHEAVNLAGELRRKDPNDPRIVALQMELAMTLGRYAELERLHARLSGQLRSAAPVMTAFAKYLELRGRYEQAVKLLRGVRGPDGENIRALGALGRALWLSGRKDEALRVLRGLKRKLQKRGHLEKSKFTAAQLVEAGQALGLYSQIAPEPKLADFALNDVIVAAAKKEPRNPGPHIASARLLASRFNFAEAAQDYRRALAIAPEHPDALAGLARLELERYRFKQARDAARRALITDPKHPGAHLALGDYRLAGGEIKRALEKIELALQVNPRLAEALGRKVGCLVLLGRETEASETRKALPTNGALRARALVAEGKVYLDQRRFDLARAAFESALAADRTFAGASRMLGLCQMLGGEEKKAYDNLSRAHDIDPYNRKTFNLLEVSDWMRANLTERRIDGLRLKVTKAEDAVLGALIAGEIQSTFDELKGIYKLAPGDVLVEVFPDHRTFSMRTAGQTWIATVGACTGPVAALTSPKGSKDAQLNWRRILRHELTHAVTVVGTGYRVPVWFTEGCAVCEESRLRGLRPVAWMESLARRLRRGKLIPLEGLSAAFVRPESMEERQLAYFQSALAVEFIVERKGFGAVTAALRDFAGGADTREMLERRLNMTPEEFDAAMEEYARSVLSRAVTLGGFDRDDYERARRRLDRNPKDDEALCEFAVALAGLSRRASMSEGIIVRGIEAARAAAKNEKYKLRATRALGWLYLKAGRARQAEETFAGIVKTKEDPESLVGLARASAQRGAATRALEFLKRARAKAALEPAILLWASRAAARAGLTQESMEWLKAYLDTGIDDKRASMRYGRYARKMGRLREAAECFRNALSLDPYSLDAYIGLGEALLDAGDAERALFYLEIALKLEPDDPTVAALLARGFKLLNRMKDAVRMARKAVSFGADPEPLRDILRGNESRGSQ